MTQWIYITGSKPWTPSQLGSSVLKLWLDASDISTITKNGSNYVSQWNDKSGNNNHVSQSTASLQPSYSSSYSIANNKQAIIFPSSETGTKLNTDTVFQLREVIFICAYKDGLDTTFDSYDTLLSSDLAYGEPRIMGNINTSDFIESSQFNNYTYKNNNSTSSRWVLRPMPLCMIRAVSSTTHNRVWTIGGSRPYPAVRNWRGPICEVIGFNRNLTNEEISNLWTYAQNKWGIS